MDSFVFALKLSYWIFKRCVLYIYEG